MVMDATLRPLPPASSLSPSVLSFINSKFSTKEDLNFTPTLLSELRIECNGLDQALSDNNKQLQKCLIDYASHSEQLKRLFSDVNSQLLDLRVSTQSHSSSSDGESGRVLGEELPALAKEVSRVETVRIYAETALRLDTLVGDIEDAVSATVNRSLRRHPTTNNSEETRVEAIKALKTGEDVLASIRKTHPQWTRLVSAVDHRVDRALAILRPQAIADHRALLARLGWPPSLSALNSLKPDDKKSAGVSNPLLTMQGDLKHQFCESFLALCSLQELQRRRKSRQLEGYNQDISTWQPLWAIEELVNPLAIASERHFTKWIDKPEFIFALVYKIIRDYVDSMDELLQPLIDEAMLSGYSCREEWISGMVTSLSTYLAKEIFPMYCGQINEESVTGVKSQTGTAWLHLVDLMMAFDKRIQTLVSHSGLLLSLQEDGNLQKISSLSVFCDRPDWLELWAEIELRDVLDKLDSEIDNEKSWSIKVQGADFLSGQDHKAPTICSAFLRHISSLIDRCRLLPTIALRSRFVLLTCAPIIRKFLDCLVHRCQEAEGLTALTDDDALTKVAKSVNAARYFENVLNEWCEDVFFLEMGLDHIGNSETAHGESSSASGLMEAHENGIFDKELRMLEKFRTEWVEKLSTVVLRGFDSNCGEYMKNRKQWQEQGEEGWGVSRSFVGALDYLQAKMSVLEEALNRMDFTGVWRSLASGVDRIILHGILTSKAKFSDGGIQRLGNDLAVLYGVFAAWCLRPEGFFPRVSEGLKLLRLEERQLRNGLAEGEIWLKQNGMRHLTIADAERISKNRMS